MFNAQGMSTRAATVIVTLAISALASTGCGKKEAPQEAHEQPQAAAIPQPVQPIQPAKINPGVEARKVFTSRCVVCHGTSGEGNGPGAAALNPKPRSFRDASWQTSVDDGRIASAIVEGGAGVQLSPSMPPNPDLKGKPEVVAQLVRIVRGFKH